MLDCCATRLGRGVRDTTPAVRDISSRGTLALRSDQTVLLAVGNFDFWVRCLRKDTEATLDGMDGRMATAQVCVLPADELCVPSDSFGG